MWDEEKDFETINEANEYDSNDENADDFMFPELYPSEDEGENQDSNLFDYDAGFYYDEEDE